MPEERTESEPRIKRAWGTTAAWIAGITTAVGFIGTISGAFTSVSEHLHRHKDSDVQIALAQTQMKEGDYPRSVATYAAVVKADPGYKPAIDGEVATTERWVENFQFFNFDNEQTRTANALMLDQIISILEMALSRAKDVEKADIQAHVGWAHWLNSRFLSREDRATAEQDFRSALAVEPNNVYANAMFGNYILQTHDDLTKASAAFDKAFATGKEHAYVRRLQVGGLIYLQEPGARAMLFRTLNTMRQNNEPITEDRRMEARGFCCIPGSTFHDELIETFSSVPRDDAWETYLWLSNGNTEDPAVQHLKQLFIQALLTEIAGDRALALQQFRELDKQVEGVGTNLDESVPEEIKRLETHP